MSNTESSPDELVCGADAPAALQVLTPRDVPLGGPRAMTVRRTLPQRERSLIGAWCFLDHYGPDDVSETGGMDVPPHPHTGLQTVSWLFSGTADTTVLHGAQLWVALPQEARFVDKTFEHYAPPTVEGGTDGGRWAAQVFLDSLVGSTSPVVTHTPLLGAELRLERGTVLALDVDPTFEHGVLVDTGAVLADADPVAKDELGYLAPGRDRITLRATDDTRLLLVGGPPFGEQIVMWWNFVGRSHDDVVEYRDAWQAEIEGKQAGEGSDGPFGLPEGDRDAPLPAPALPNARIRPRS
jgi:redox-sensitive bicupin YhaK (pirin superfamily)